MAKQKTKSKKKTGQKTDSGQTVQNQRAEEVRDKLKAVESQVEEGFIDFSQLLSEAYHMEYYREWGFKTFEDYCNRELRTKYRKAKYFVEIWDKVKSLDLPREEVEKIGWTRMKDIAAVINEKNAKAWLKKAKEMSSRDLEEAIKITRRKDTSGANVPSTVTMKFTMSEDEASIISNAIEEAKKLCESTNEAVALEMICQDWLMDKGASPERTPLEATIKYLEEAFGISIDYKATRKEKTQEEESKEVVKEASKKGTEEVGGLPDADEDLPDDTDDDLPYTEDEDKDVDIDSLLGLD